jgi:CheY-like chemotaxis protein
MRGWRHMGVWRASREAPLMNSLLVSPRGRGQEPGRILAIESDPERSKTLEQVLRGHVRAHLVVVKSVDQAIRSMMEKLPDLILTSPFLKPAEEAALSTHLRRTPPAAHVQVITVPHSIETDDDAGRSTPPRMLGFLRRRSTAPSACAPDTLRNEIEAYLVEARAARTRLSVGLSHSLCVTTALAPRTVPAPAPIVVAQSVVRRPHLLGGSEATDRRRARRRPATELPGLWAVRFPLCPEAKVVDISSTGVLVETSSKISPGGTLDLHVLGQNIDFRVPARMVRSEVASVDRLGVKYRAAAAFSHELDIAGLQMAAPPDASTMPKVLADMLARVLSDVDRRSSDASLRARFEQELRQLLPVREIKIRRTPVIPDETTESVYFTVPRASGSRPILQAVFEPDYLPSAIEFRILKAAAGVAAVILEFAPLGEEAQTPTLELVTCA